MSMPYSKLPTNVWKKIGMNAGVLLTAFDPQTGAVNRANIIGATTGPVRFAAKPRLTDFGAGVNNCPKNAKEMLSVDGWDVKLSGTFISADTPATKRLVALADAASGHVSPRGSVDILSDFGEIWYLFDYGDVHDGQNPGRYAIHMQNALNTAGFAVQTGDMEKARWPFEFTAFCSVEDDGAGFEVWIVDGVAE